MLLGARVYRDSNQSIPNTTYTAVSLNTETFDVGGLWDAGSPTRLTAKIAGYYLITGDCQFAAASASAYRFLILTRNGDTTAGRLAETRPPTAAFDASVPFAIDIAAVAYLDVDDYVEMWAYQDSGGNLDLLTDGIATPCLSMALLTSNEGAKAYISSDQTIPNATWTAITFDSEVFDTDGIHSTVSNTDRFTVQTTGYYLLLGEVIWYGGGSGIRRITGIGKNGLAGGAGTLAYAWNGVATFNNVQVCNTIVYLEAGDYVTLCAYQDSGGNLDLKSEWYQDVPAPAFTIFRLDAAEGARAYNSANNTIGTGSWTPVTLNSEAYDTDAIHSTATNTSRLTAQTAGYYIICGNVRWDNSTAGNRRNLKILYNGTTDLAFFHPVPATWPNYDQIFSIITIYYLDIGDYVEISVYQDTGGNLALNHSGTEDPVLSIHRLLDWELIELSLTEGIKTGDATSELMESSLSVLEGLKGGDVPVNSNQAFSTLLDGLKFSDDLLAELIGTILLSLTEGIKLGEYEQDKQRYEYYNTGDTNQEYLHNSTWSAQTFTPSIAHKITSVKLRLYRFGNPGTVTVSIRATAGNGHPTGGDLCSGTTDGNTLPTGSPYEWREVTLGSGYNLSASTKYAIVVRASNGDSSNYLAWRLNISGTYTGGNQECSYDSGVSWWTESVCDHVFEEWSQQQCFGVSMSASPDLTEGLTSGDVLSLALLASLQLTDGVSLGESLSATLAFYVTLTDGIKLGESFSAVITKLLSLVEGIKQGDSTSLIMKAYPSMVEGLTLGDALQVLMSTMSVSITDGIKFTDTSFINLEGAILYLALTEGINLGESFLTSMASNLQLADGTKFNELLSLVSILHLQDGVKLGETTLAQLISYLSHVEGVKFGDAKLVSALMNITLHDGTKFGDSVIIRFRTLVNLVKLILSTRTYHDMKIFTEPYHDVKIYTGEDAMTIRRDWQRGETVPIWATVTVKGALYDPDQGVLIYLYDPDGNVISGVNGVAMTKDSEGSYVYYWNSSTGDEPGWYRPKGKAQDGEGSDAKVTIESGSFQLQ
jgi:hypothetical protein